MGNSYACALASQYPQLPVASAAQCRHIAAFFVKAGQDVIYRGMVRGAKRNQLLFFISFLTPKKATICQDKLGTKATRKHKNRLFSQRSRGLATGRSSSRTRARDRKALTIRVAIGEPVWTTSCRQWPTTTAKTQRAKCCQMQSATSRASRPSRTLFSSGSTGPSSQRTTHRANKQATHAPPLVTWRRLRRRTVRALCSSAGGDGWWCTYRAVQTRRVCTAWRSMWQCGVLACQYTAAAKKDSM